jgi:hypothetical protein
VVVQRGSPVVSRLHLPQGVPALLVALQGSLLGKAHITQFGGHDIWEEEVWLCAKSFCATLSCTSTVQVHVAATHE